MNAVNLLAGIQLHFNLFKKCGMAKEYQPKIIFHMLL